jgi:hypothetical protein
MQRLTLYMLMTCLFAVSLVVWFLQQAPATMPPARLQLGLLQQQDIKTIGIVDGRGTIANLQFENGSWYETISGYRANTLLIGNLLDNVFRTQILETKTSRTELYSRLGVEPVRTPGARGVELRLSNDSSEYFMTFGDITSNGQYMRTEADPATLLISPAIDLPTDRIDWLDRELISVPAAELISISLQHADGEQIRLAKADPAQTRFTLLNLPQGRQLKTPETANSIAGILSELRMESARRTEQLPDRKPDVTAEFRTRDDMLVGSQAFITDDAVYFTFTILSDPDGTNDGLAKELQGWAYTLPAFKRNQFLTRLDDLLQ